MNSYLIWLMHFFYCESPGDFIGYSLNIWGIKFRELSVCGI